MTKATRRAARMERLLRELQRKYLAASEKGCVWYDILWDIRRLKKYQGLNPGERSLLCERAVSATEGEPRARGLVEEARDQYGSLAAFYA